ncbi:uncharacterized protein CXQ87_003911 [Candidozyma duobushaemuli]|uniref:Uncharacterized protein n=2 Tax=Candidozyma TaxID=3303203 RepID=A0ABX8I860_9ASCO|nr:uncharacterized protein CXQ87_003911 [[Candida] duobushaemulonis]PVH16048.1 hypothetical protein CXQ87_003911 [[Candida] duobushaemulonis]QWU89267.1 hypothetical protein CA3LBN_003590 [[Candida] haemuloni]
MLHRFATFIPFVLIAGSTVMLLFINLSGASDNSVFLNKFYFSKATVKFERRWTMYAMCTPYGDGQVQCTKKSPAYPYDPSRNLGASHVPEEFDKNQKTYFYLSKIAYSMFLLALLCSILSLLPVTISCCACTGFLTGFFASFVIGGALFLDILACSLQTAAHVKGVNAFKKAGFSASLGTPMFVCMWLSVGTLFVAWVWMIKVGVAGFHQMFGGGKKKRSYDSESDGKNFSD